MCQRQLELPNRLYPFLLPEMCLQLDKLARRVHEYLGQFRELLIHRRKDRDIVGFVQRL